MAGVTAIAEKGVVHRDLKPANILLHFPDLTEVEKSSPDFTLANYIKGISLIAGEDGTPAANVVVKIADCGLSKQLQVGQVTQTCVGSPNYMAPEILERKQHSHSADVWSLGCVFYLLLTGFVPFYGYSVHNLSRNIRKGTYFFPKTCKL